jgi:ketosteroid isomerase-like protein
MEAEMVSWLAEKLVSHNMRRLNAGDIRPTLRMEADDVTLRFPGDSSWSGEHRGKREVRPWLERFARVGLQIFADEVIVKGFPWNQTLCVRGHDYLRGADGESVYENRYVIWGRLRWGRLQEYEVYEDTQKASALDEYLVVYEQPAAVS